MMADKPKTITTEFRLELTRDLVESEKMHYKAASEIDFSKSLREASDASRKSSEEIFQFTKKYPYALRGFPFRRDTAELDWWKVKSEYQGIIIAPYQWECRLSLDSEWYYGWDCASGCIWDTSCIEKFEALVYP